MYRMSMTFWQECSLVPSVPPTDGALLLLMVLMAQLCHGALCHPVTLQDMGVVKPVLSPPALSSHL